MFGVLVPCRTRTADDLRRQWMGHFCGLCLALRDHSGQFSRLTTNYDTLVLSILVEAQLADGGQHRVAGPCPLRGMRTQRVAIGAAASLAAAASLLLAAATVTDHIRDGDGPLGSRPMAGAARRSGSWLRRRGDELAAHVGLDTAPIHAALDRQGRVEARAGPDSSLAELTAATGEVTAHFFAHSALLAGAPANAGPLAEAGRAFGELAHLLDAAADYQDDLRNGAWNPLIETGTGRSEAEHQCRSTLRRLTAALRKVDFADRALPDLVLGSYAVHAVDRTFGRRPTGSCHVRHRPPSEPATVGALAAAVPPFAATHEPGQTGSGNCDDCNQCCEGCTGQCDDCCESCGQFCTNVVTCAGVALGVACATVIAVGCGKACSTYARGRRDRRANRRIAEQGFGDGWIGGGSGSEFTEPQPSRTGRPRSGGSRSCGCGANNFGMGSGGRGGAGIGLGGGGAGAGGGAAGGGAAGAAGTGCYDGCDCDSCCDACADCDCCDCCDCDCDCCDCCDC